MTYYDILMVKNTATDEEIKIAYRNLIKAFHPDYYAGPKEFGEQQTRLIIQAYTVLRDPEKRKKYDEWLQKKKRAESIVDEDILFKEKGATDMKKKDGRKPNNKKTVKKIMQMAGILLVSLVFFNFLFPLSSKINSGMLQNKTGEVLGQKEYTIRVSAEIKPALGEFYFTGWNYSAKIQGEEVIASSKEITVSKGDMIAAIVEVKKEESSYSAYGRREEECCVDDDFTETLLRKEEVLMRIPLTAENPETNEHLVSFVALLRFELL